MVFDLCKTRDNPQMEILQLILLFSLMLFSTSEDVECKFRKGATDKGR